MPKPKTSSAKSRQRPEGRLALLSPTIFSRIPSSQHTRWQARKPDPFLVHPSPAVRRRKPRGGAGRGTKRLALHAEHGQAIPIELHLPSSSMLSAPPSSIPCNLSLRQHAQTNDSALERSNTYTWLPRVLKSSCALSFHLGLRRSLLKSLPSISDEPHPLLLRSTP